MVDNIQKAYVNSTVDLYTDFEWKVWWFASYETEATVSLHSYFIHFINPESFYCASNWQVLAVHKMLCILSDVLKTWNQFMQHVCISLLKNLEVFLVDDNIPERTLPRVVSFKITHLVIWSY